MSKVYFTSMGTVTALGIGQDETCEKLFSQESGISEIVTFPIRGQAKKAGVIKDFDGGKYFDPNLTRRMERFSQLVLVSSKLAIERAEISREVGGEYGSIYSSYWGSLQVTEEFFRKLIKDGPLQIQPMLFPCLVTNASLGRVAKNYQLTNVSSFLVGSCPLEYSFNLMSNRDVKGVVTGACDELYDSNFASFDDAGYLKRDKDEVIEAFSGKTNGTVLGEGAIVFVLEKEEQAIARNSKKLGELVVSNSRFVPLIIDPISNEEAIKRFSQNLRNVIEEAGIDKLQIGCIISMANSDKDVDFVEAKSLSEVFGEELPNIPVITPKEVFGEIPGVGSSLAAYTALEIFRKEKLPPLVKWLDKAGNLNRKESEILKFDRKFILCNSFIPGGNINSMIIGKC